MGTKSDYTLQFRVSSKRYSYLLDHRIGENCIIPASLYIEKLLSVGEKQYGLPLLLKDVHYSRALSVNGDENYDMEVLLVEKNSETDCRITVGNERVLCASATIEALSSANPGHIDISKIIDRCAEKREGKAYYDYMAHYNLNFGPRHQGLKFIYLGEDEAIAQLEILPENEDPEFFAHPSFLDTFSHAGLFALSDLNATQIYVTADQGRFELFQNFPKTVWCHSKIVRRARNEIFVDLGVYTLEGNLVARVINYRLKVIEQFLLLPERYLYYTLDWKKIVLENQTKNKLPSHIMFLGDKNPFTGQIASKISKIDLDSTNISDPANTAVILYASNENLDIFQSNMMALNQLLRLVQSLSNLHGSELFRLIVLYEDNLKYASISGFCHVINQEMPNLKLQQILVDSSSSIDDCIADALSRPYENQRVAYQKNEVFAFRLTPVYEPSEQKSLLPEASYLVTGGLGGIGFAIARWLLKAGVKQVILLHRSEVTSAQKTVLDDLNGDEHRVVAIQCDILDKETLIQAIHNVHNKPYPLKGIFHAAGTTKDNLVPKLSPTDIDLVLKPKLMGVLNLHEATKAIDLDYFVLFSSVTSFLGTKGVANYAAANAFLNEFARYRRDQGLVATSINWGPWAEGMLTKLGEKVTKSWEEQGFRVLSGDQGAHCMSEAMRMNHPALAVMPVEWMTLLSKYAPGNNCTVLSEIQHALGAHFEDTNTVTDILPSLQSADPEERMDLLSDYLLDRIQKLTGSTLSDLDLPFTRFGIDSITAVELSSQLERDFHTAISQTIVYNYPNIVSLAEYLISNKLALKEKIPERELTANTPVETAKKISDEELSKLLDKELGDLEDLK